MWNVIKRWFATLAIIAIGVTGGALEHIRQTPPPVISRDEYIYQATSYGEYQRFPALDATMRIYETSVKFKYPIHGFYNRGVRFTYESTAGDSKRRWVNTIHVGSDLSYASYDLFDDCIGHDSYGASVYVSVYKRMDGESLDAFIKELYTERFVDPPKSVIRVTIRGKNFLLWKKIVSATESYWEAVSYGKEEMIDVSLYTVLNADRIQFARSINDDLLFLQFLSEIEFS